VAGRKLIFTGWALDRLEFEKEALSKGYKFVCGVDEAGRGPLAGPVYAAAVILPQDFKLEGLDDSKKLSAKKRDILFDLIKEQALAYNIATASVEEIDTLNILQATFLAMRRAVEGLEPKADFALVDGNRTPPLQIESLALVGGDSLSASVAAASVLAKVARDRLMTELDEMYPQYEFGRHKGYGTKLHYEKLASYGPSPAHRKTFLKNMDRAKKDITTE